MTRRYRPGKVIHKLGGQFVQDVGGIERAVQFVPYPPADKWFIRGSRGGVYLAVGERTRSWSDQYDDDWMRNLWSVLDESEDTVYIRPGSKLYKEATES